MMANDDGSECDEYGRHTIPLINDNLRAGLALLWQAYRYAQDVGADLWDFALESDKLYEAELTVSDLRWLVAKGFAEHGQETSFYGDPHRSFRPSTGLNLVPTTCFVLTPKGAEFAVSTLKEPAAARYGSASLSTLANVATDHGSPLVPPGRHLP
jgi:hypothetical protein